MLLCRSFFSNAVILETNTYFTKVRCVLNNSNLISCYHFMRPHGGYQINECKADNQLSVKHKVEDKAIQRANKVI